MFVPVKATVQVFPATQGDPVEVGVRTRAAAVVGQAGERGDPDGEEYPLATK